MPTPPRSALSLAWLALASWAALFALAGCVAARYGSEDETITRTEPSPIAGAPAIVTVTHTKRKTASYTDTTQAGAAASNVFGEFGGIGGILASIPTGGLVGGGAGILGLLGVVARMTHTNAKLKGESAGWDQREKAATVQAPLPGTVTATASTSTGATT